MDLREPMPVEQTGEPPSAGTAVRAAPRLFVDLTSVVMLADAAPIGPTRLEAELARRLLARPALNPVPVMFDEHGSMFALDDEAAEAILSPNPPEVALRRRTDLPAGPYPGPQPPPPMATDARPTPLRMATASARWVARNGVRSLPAAIREDVRAILIHGRQIGRTIMQGRLRGPPVPAASALAGLAEAPRTPVPPARPALRAAVHPGAGDVLWTSARPDGAAQLRHVAEAERYRGMRVAALFHGPPRAMPSPDPSAALHEALAIDLLRVASRVAVLSEAGRAGLLACAARLGLPAPPIDVVPPGSSLAGLPMPPAGEGLVAELVGARRFALAVGAVAPSGNQLLLLRAWDRLAAEPGFGLDLVILGELGAGAKAVARRVEASPLFGTRVIWIERCPDEVLAALLQAAEVVLSPALTDTGTAAILEALALGRPVIAAGREAPPEGALAAATWVDPRDDAAWAAALRRVAAAGRAPAARIDPPGWEAGAQALAAALAALMAMPAEH